MLKRFRSATIMAACVLLTSQPAPAQQATAAEIPDAAASVTVESYYRIKWGSDGEFMALYRKNHLPILEEAQKRGLISDIRIDMPYTHMAGGTRWDLRTTITYRDASAALLKNPAFLRVFDDMQALLKKENASFDEEEARRFSLLEEHWDVVLMPN
jgi:hypothetical protein